MTQKQRRAAATIIESSDWNKRRKGVLFFKCETIPEEVKYILEVTARADAHPQVRKVAKETLVESNCDEE